MFDSYVSLSLTDPVSPEDPMVNDTPIKLEFISSKSTTSQIFALLKVKYDNISISATNTAPTVGVNDVVSNKFNLFPNPAATDIVTITNNENIGIEKIEVYDVMGKQLQTTLYNGAHEVQLNTSDLSVGTYLLHITTNEGVGIKKLIKK